MDGSLPESSASRFSKIGHRCIHSRQRHPHVGAQSHSARRSIFVQKCAKQRGWSSRRTVLEVEGTSQQGCPCSEKQSSKGLDSENSHPAAFSTCAKLGGGHFGTCCGQFYPKRPEQVPQMLLRDSLGTDCWSVEQRQGPLLG